MIPCMYIQKYAEEVGFRMAEGRGPGFFGPNPQTAYQYIAECSVLAVLKDKPKYNSRCLMRTSTLRIWFTPRPPIPFPCTNCNKQAAQYEGALPPLCVSVEDSASGVGSAYAAEMGLIVGYVGASHISEVTYCCCFLGFVCAAFCGGCAGVVRGCWRGWLLVRVYF